MKLVALYSGGKDSTFAIYKARQEGHEIIYLATIHSKNPDSYMYHTPNIAMTILQAECLQINLVSKESYGEKEKEVDDIKILLNNLGVEGVVCGAIMSKYQKDRIEKVCKELNLKLIAPLWHKDQKKLLEEMIENGFEIIITSVSAEGLDENWLGRKLDKKALEELVKIHEKYKINISGEGGEYESLVLDCPLYTSKIEITKAEKQWKGNFGVYLVEDAKLIPKDHNHLLYQ